MTDAEIIKALKICTSEDLGCQDGCPYISGGCVSEIKKHVLDLINRQKAEIDRLTALLEIERFYGTLTNESSKTAKAEAIKEFAERLKEELRLYTENNGGFVPSMIDNLVKEVVGETDV